MSQTSEKTKQNAPSTRDTAAVGIASGVASGVAAGIDAGVASGVAAGIDAGVADAVGVIAIGRNEGDRLERCLRSVVGRVGTVVYVDSGSTDRSVELARSLGADVVELDMTKPFTAARARNEGLDRLREIHPDATCVQMIDGDCQVVENWLDTAIAALRENQKLAVVCGRRRERFPDATIYNRMTDMEWDTPVGPAKSCGGDAMFRIDAITQIGGYNPDVIAGEEPELCVRLRQQGWTVERLDAEMTLHDAAMTRFSQWWKRNVRAGHAYAEGAFRHGAPPERHNVKQVKSILFWGLLLPAVIETTAISSFFLKGNILFVTGVLGLIGWSAFGLLGYKIYRYRLSHGDAGKHAAAYALFTVIGKFANASGLLKFHTNRILKRRTKIIEYKNPPPLSPRA